MQQFIDDNGNVVQNSGYYLEDPVNLASGAVSTAFTQKTIVVLTARTAECFFRISAAGTAATANSHSLPVGASRQVPVNIGDRIACSSTGGTLSISVLGNSHVEPRANYY